MLTATEADIKRFMSYVDILPNGCWFWTGGRSRGKGNKKWYGSFHLGKSTVRAHRFACEVLGGKPLDAGHHRDHICRFSLCVNPDHLEPVPSEVNQQRKMDRIRAMLNQLQKKIKISDIPEEDRAKIVQLILDHLKLEVIEEATPDYVAYELAPVLSE